MHKTAMTRKQLYWALAALAAGGLGAAGYAYRDKLFPRAGTPAPDGKLEGTAKGLALMAGPGLAATGLLSVAAKSQSAMTTAEREALLKAAGPGVLPPPMPGAALHPEITQHTRILGGRGGAFHPRLGAHVGPNASAATLAHELGHAQNFRTSPTRVRLATGVPFLLGQLGSQVAGTVAGGYTDPETGAAVGAGSGLVLGAPRLIEEGAASLKGLKLMRQAGLRPGVRGYAGLAAALGTYLAQAVAPAAGAGYLAGVWNK